MIKHFVGALVLCLIGSAELFKAKAVENNYDLNWYSIDCGGGVSTSGDSSFELAGTIGQHDAGPGTGSMNGGGFSLTGGFRIRIAPGDCNIDGGINIFDFVQFGDCASGPGGGLSQPRCSCIDFDGDKDVDIVDYGVMQTRLRNP